MWTMTPRGFFSAVQHRDDAALLVVRTRVWADADTLADWYANWMHDLMALEPQAVAEMPEPVITSYEWSDYPWRVIMPRTAWAAFMAESVEDLDYGNFKDAVKAVQGEDRAHVYGSVWAVLLRLTALDPKAPETPEDYDGEPDWDQYLAWASRNDLEA